METLTKKEAMYKRIEGYGINLNKIFHTRYEPIVLCKRLRVLERKAQRLTADLCNGLPEPRELEAEAEVELDLIEDRVNIILNNKKGLQKKSWQLLVKTFINRDPKGYALKIDDNYVREHGLEIRRDLGGYGIIAPDLTGE